MTVEQLIKKLQKHDPELEVFAIHSSSGASHDVEAVFENTYERYDAGPLIDKPGERVVIIAIDH